MYQVDFQSQNFPYFITSEEEDPSEIALKRLAYKSVWPPLLFGSAFMTWHHKTWEKILKLVTRKRKLSFLVMDLFRHTHHSAWHTMHNVICGGAKMMDPCLEILRRVGARVTVVQGSRDQVVPVECSNNIKVMVPDAEVKIIKGANHNKVIMGREKQFAEDLEHIWDSVNDAVNSR
ncbi:putative alpha/Beta hydrolase [Helianthus annuus]|uniref:Alpha/Beta hydrolase n=1 Tax=Helianthus annuus TaxID=4232 RepID=A0A9K3P6D9_HELAN|nr:putative alpha/Beta hydrolase [Helianthus annuus]KAJ0913955.1 putative alpha/Beta hydrolase [Helianthus annuus]